SRRPSTMRTPPPRPSADRRETSMAIQTKPRKFLNDPADVVKESLAGLAAAHPDLLRYDAAAQIIVRKDAPRQGKVALISGGGSGHEPLHGGFVGRGMLDAACPGEVFTSPVPEQMLAATKAVDGGAGVIHIVKNYTGDVMNFRLAAEDAADEGIDVESGRRRAPLAPARELAREIVEPVLSDLEPRGSRVLAFVNGMGGTPQLELYLLYHEVDKLLRAAGLEPVRNLVGSYITSLEMAGASVTVLELDDELESLWDAPVDTPALRWGA